MIKIDGIGIFEVKVYKNVVIEQTVKIWSHPEEVPIYAGFNYRDLIGIAKIWTYRNKIFANLSLFIDVKGYPSIGYVQENRRIFCVSIGVEPNADKRILQIGV